MKLLGRKAEKHKRKMIDKAKGLIGDGEITEGYEACWPLIREDGKWYVAELPAPLWARQMIERGHQVKWGTWGKVEITIDEAKEIYPGIAAS